MATARKGSRLKRSRNRMPAAVRAALSERGLTKAYKARPAYQRNDYLGWIAGAKLDATKQKRIARMLSELRGGRKYMGMAWTGGK